MKTDLRLANSVLANCRALGRISEEKGALTRTFLSPAMRAANAMVAGVMKKAGLSVREDAISNLIGRLESAAPGAKTFLLGSHLDTVRNAGMFDGPLGVFVGIAAIQNAVRQGARFPFHIEVIGFCEEEGVRYQVPYLGSRAVAGTLRPRDLKPKDDAGIAVGEALRRAGFDPALVATAARERKDILGYTEVHIEQGPLLEAEGRALGVVEAISGQTRARIRFEGITGHAGTTPMRLRHDALCGAAEFVLCVEKYARRRKSLVATVGQAQVRPGAGNVIPGEVILSLDVRDADEKIRASACRYFIREGAKIAKRRKLRFSATIVAEAPTVRCDKKLISLLRKASLKHQKRVIGMPSGAGHDAVPMSDLCPVAMLFVRCKGGISHNPAESARVDDIAIAISALTEYLIALAKS